MTNYFYDLPREVQTIFYNLANQFDILLEDINTDGYEFNFITDDGMEHHGFIDEDGHGEYYYVLNPQTQPVLEIDEQNLITMEQAPITNWTSETWHNPNDYQHSSYYIGFANSELIGNMSWGGFYELRIATNMLEEDVVDTNLFPSTWTIEYSIDMGCYYVSYFYWNIPNQHLFLVNYTTQDNPVDYTSASVREFLNIDEVMFLDRAGTQSVADQRMVFGSDGYCIVDNDYQPAPDNVTEDGRILTFQDMYYQPPDTPAEKKLKQELLANEKQEYCECETGVFRIRQFLHTHLMYEPMYREHESIYCIKNNKCLACNNKVPRLFYDIQMDPNAYIDRYIAFRNTSPSNANKSVGASYYIEPYEIQQRPTKADRKYLDFERFVMKRIKNPARQNITSARIPIDAERVRQKRTDLQRRKARDQKMNQHIGFGINHTFSNVELFTQISHTLTKLSSSLSSISNNGIDLRNNFTDRASNIVDNFTSDLKSYAKIIAIDVLIAIIVSFLLYFAYINKWNITFCMIIISLIAAAIGYHFKDTIYSYITKLFTKTIPQDITESPQAFEFIDEPVDEVDRAYTWDRNTNEVEFLEQRADTPSILSKIYKAFYKLMSFFTIGIIPKDFDNMCLKAERIPKALDGFQKIILMMKNSWEWVLEKIKVHLCGMEPTLKFDGGESDVKDWAENVLEYTPKHMQDKMKTDGHICRKVVELYLQGQKFLTRKSSMNKAANDVVTATMPALRKLYEEAMKSPIWASGMRVKPIGLYLCGPSSIGKTGCVYPLSIDVLRECGMLSKEILEVDPNAWERKIYARFIAQEFYDGYVPEDHEILIMDDAFSVRDSLANPNLEYQELIQIINMFQMNVHMAALEEKANTRMQAKLVILTSNSENLNVESMTCPEAIVNRLTHPFRVEIKDEFKDDRGRLVVPSGGDPLNMDVYQFRRITFDKLGKVASFSKDTLSYDQLKDEIVGQIKANYTRQADLQAFLNRRAFSQHGDDWSDLFDVPKKIHTVGDFYAAAAKMKQAKEKKPDSYFKKMVASFKQKPAQKDEVDSFVDAPEATTQDLIAALGGKSRAKLTSLKLWLQSLQTRIMAHVTSNHLYAALATVLGVIGLYFAGRSLYNWMKPKPPRVRKDVEMIQCSATEDMVKWIANLPAPEWTQPKNLTIPGTYMNWSFRTNEKIKNIIYRLTGWKIYPDVSEDLLNELARTNGATDVNRYLKKKKELMDMQQHATYGKVGRAGGKFRYAGAVKTGRVKQMRRSGEDDSVSLSVDEIYLVYMFMKGLGDRVKCEFGHLTGYDSETGDLVWEAEDGTVTVTSCKKEMIQKNDQEARNVVNKVQRESKGHIYEIYYELEGVTRRLGHALCVQGAAFICPYHFRQAAFLRAGKDPNAKIGVRCEGMKDLVWASISYFFNGVQFERADGTGRDLYMFAIGDDKHQIISPRASLIKNLIGTKEEENAHMSMASALMADGRGLDKALRTREVTGYIEQTEQVYCSNYTKVFDSKTKQPMYKDGEFDPNGDIRYIDNYSMTYDSQNGDCGAPLIVSNPQCKGKICGMLVGQAGSQTLFEPFTKEEIIDALQMLPWRTSQIRHEELPLNQKGGQFEMPEGNFIPLGTLPDAGPRAFNTKIVKSLIHGEITEPTVRPALLKKTEQYGDPLIVGLKKCGGAPSFIPEKYVDMVFEDIKHKLLTPRRGFNVRDYKRVLTYKEAIEGIEGNTFIRPLVRVTSAGYPDCLDQNAKKNGMKGKQYWLGKDEYIYDEPQCIELRQKTERRIRHAAQGIRDPSYWLDSNKDEPRAIKEDKWTKPRVFAAANTDTTIALRQYFLGFSAFLMEHRITNEIAVGTNAYSHEWSQIVRYLRGVGDHMIAGDFSNYDGTLSSVILNKICDLANEFYDDGEENVRIRQTLFTEISAGLHIANHTVYQWLQSYPSGNPFTSVFNSIYNIMSMRLVWLMMTGRSLQEFNNNVRMIAYGDDNIVSVATESHAYFNMQVITDGYAKIGMKYTDELKSGLMNDFRSITEVQFLKRHFVYNEDLKKWVAPLRKETLYEMMDWVQKTLPLVVATATNIEMAMLEASIWDEEFFKLFHQQVMTVVRKQPALHKALKIGHTYDDYMIEWMNANVPTGFGHSYDNTDENLQQCGSGVKLDNRSQPHQRKSSSKSGLLFRRSAHLGSPLQARDGTIPNRHGRLLEGLLGSGENNRPAANFLNQHSEPTTITDLSSIEDSPVKTEAETTQIEQPTNAGEATMEVTSHQIVTFVDDAKILSKAYTPAYGPIQNVREMERSSTPDYTMQSIQTFLKTPILLQQGTWTIDNKAIIGQLGPQTSELAVLSSSELPQAWISGGIDHSTRPYSKLLANTMLKGTFKVKLQATAQRFQQGILRLVAFPLPDILTNRRKNAFSSGVTLSQLRHVDLVLGQVDAVELELEWIGPFMYYNMINDSHTFWEISVIPYIELGDVSGVGQVEYTVWCHIEDPEIRMPNGLTMAVKPAGMVQFERMMAPNRYSMNQHVQIEEVSSTLGTSDHPTTSSQDEGTVVAQQGTISGIAKDIGSIAGMAAKVPGLTEFAAPVAVVANTVAGIASMFGQSKTINKETTNATQLVTGRYFGNYDGQVEVQNLSFAAHNELTEIDKWAGSPLDELHLNNIATQGAPVDTFTWSTNQLTSTVLKNIPVTVNWNIKAEPGANQPQLVVMPPCSYVAKFGSLYRGSPIVTLRTAKTEFHKGLLKIIYSPYDFSPASGFPSNFDENNCLSIVWDVGKTDTISFRCPFVEDHQWKRVLPVHANVTNDISHYDIGRLYVKVQNQLRAVSTAMQSIRFAVEVSMGTDFEIAVPRLPKMAPWDGEQNPLPMNQHIQFEQARGINGRNVNHAGGVTLGKAGSLLEKKPNIGLSDLTGSKVERSHTAAKTTVGEVITSLRQFLKRYMPVRTVGQAGDTIVRFQIGPFDDGSSDIQDSFILVGGNNLENGYSLQVLGTDPIVTDYINLIYPLFAFRRGGMRYALAPQNINKPYSGSLEAYVPISTSDGKFIRAKVFNDIFPETDFPNCFRNIVQQTQKLDANPLDELFDFDVPQDTEIQGLIQYQLPYYSQYHCLVNELALFNSSQQNFLTTAIDNALIPINCMTLGSDIPMEVDLYRAGADDLSYGSFLGTPIVAINTEVTPSRQPNPTKRYKQAEAHQAKPVSVQRGQYRKFSPEMVIGQEQENRTGKVLRTLFATQCQEVEEELPPTKSAGNISN